MAVTSKDRKLEELNQDLSKKVEAAMSVTGDWINIWQTALTYIFGNQRHGWDIKDNWDDVAVNYIFPAMMQDISFLMQRNHKIVVKGVEDDDTEIAEAWEGAIQHMFNKTLNIPDRLLWGIYDMKVFGYAVAKTMWSPRKRWEPRTQQWEGDVTMNFIHPQFFGADPNAEFIDDESCSYVVSHRNVTKEFALSLWGNTKKGRELIERSIVTKDKEFHVSGSGSETLDTVWSDPSNEVGASLRGDRVTGLGQRLLSVIRKAFGSRSAKSDDAAIDMVTIEEIYHRDWEEENITEEGPLPASFLEDQGVIRPVQVAQGATLWIDVESGQPLSNENWPHGRLNRFQRPKYPNGRFFVRINDEILNDSEKDQVWPYEHWPYTVGVNMAIPHVWQGLNIVEPGRGLQDVVNITTGHMLNYVKNFSDPRTKVEEGANPDDPTNSDVASWLQSAAGSIVKLSEGGMNKVEFDTPAQMPAGLVQFYSLMTRELQGQTGQSDPSLGRAAGSQQTATEARVLATNARMRTSLHSKLIDRFLIRIIEMSGELMQRNYEPGRLIRILGEDNQAGGMKISQEMNAFRFDVELEVGSTLPFDEEIRKEEILKLTEIFGPAMYLELLRAFKVPNPKEILQQNELFQAFQKYVQQQEQLAERQQKMGEDLKRGQFELQKARAKMEAAKSVPG
jgi:hypothetical protein